MRTLALLRGWARSRSDVLVEGEPGVGKSLVARLIHLASIHPHAAVVVCPAVDSPGMAHPWATLASPQDTVVLDGLDRWPLPRQAELLEHLLRPWGSRLIALSRVPASRLVQEGRLLPALAGRFGPRHARLSPLRARPDDIAPIVAAMLRRAGRPDVQLEPAAWRALAEHGWPDNVRELRQVIDGALGRVRGDRLGASALVLPPLAPPSLEALADGSFAGLRQAVEGWYLRRMLHHAEGNLSEVARRTDTSRKVLRERLRRHGLYPPAAVLHLPDDTTAEDGWRQRYAIQPDPRAQGRLVLELHAGEAGERLLRLPPAPRATAARSPGGSVAA